MRTFLYTVMVTIICAVSAVQVQCTENTAKEPNDSKTTGIESSDLISRVDSLSKRIEKIDTESSESNTTKTESATAPDSIGYSGAIAIMVVFVLFIVWMLCGPHIVSVSAGHHGIIVDSSGNPTGRDCLSGNYIIFSWNNLINFDAREHSAAFDSTIRTATVSKDGKSEISYPIKLDIRITWQYYDLYCYASSVFKHLPLGKNRTISPAESATKYAVGLLKQRLSVYQKLTWRFFCTNEIIGHTIDLQSKCLGIKVSARITKVTLPKELIDHLESEARRAQQIAKAQQQADDETRLLEIAKKNKLQQTKIAARIQNEQLPIEEKMSLAEIASAEIIGMARAKAAGNILVTNTEIETAVEVIRIEAVRLRSLQKLEELRQHGAIDAETYRLMQNTISPLGVQLALAQAVGSQTAQNPNIAESVITLIMRDQTSGQPGRQLPISNRDAVPDTAGQEAKPVPPKPV
ncbi:MAG: hypothetical protein NTW50_04685 [Candidatus Berkelbacteria bacterium]|nr:hypothetical protein [Candidatus Berkelbacteria bacterium]